MNRRVVVTGLGVVSPNGVGIPDFLQAIETGRSGIRFIPLYEELHFNCQVAGVPEFNWDNLRNYLPEVTFYGLKGSTIGYAIKAAADAWIDAGNLIENGTTHWDTGCIFGNSVADTEALKRVISFVDSRQARKLGSRVIEQSMNSGATAYVSGLLGLGNSVVTNSSACATGSQAVLMGYEYIRCGLARRMVVGSNEYIDPYIFGAFDSMRILSRKFNKEPQRASRPMSSSANGFVPGSGAAALILEDREDALNRGATIYAEIIGGVNNSGGQRNGGSMTAPSREGVINCIRGALERAGIGGSQVDLISGHLTATAADKLEIECWASGLGRGRGDFPMINSLKSMIGHCLSAAGSIEIVAAILQLRHQFVHPNINLEDPHPEIVDCIGIEALPTKKLDKSLNIVAKAKFGFGDVNACLIFEKHEL
jgi:3-oxoacyl-(acyl-carrier-protein) synthase